MRGSLEDVRFAWRTLAKSPTFAIAAVASLALGVGINTAMFSITHTMLTRPISAPNPQDVVEISLRTPAGPMRLSHSEYLELKKRTRAFSGVAALTQGPYRITGQGRPEVVSALIVSPNFFSVFGQQPFLGRGFSEGKESAGEVVLTHGFWKRRFGGDRDVLGKTLVLYTGAQRLTFTVAGIAPQDFRPSPTRVPDLVLPLPELAAGSGARDFRSLTLWGRLKPGVTFEQARAETELLAEQLGSVFPASFGKAKLSFSSKVRRDPQIRAARVIIHAIVALVLLIACANVMNLLLARHEARRSEMATRLALGASRGRLVRQLLVESLILAAPSAIAGFGFAALTLHIVENLRIRGLEGMSFYFRLDPVVFCFALCAGAAAALIAGLWPARAAARPDLVPALKGMGGALGTRKFGLRGALVAGQIALSVVGITAAAMLTKGVLTLNSADPGVDAERVLVAAMSPKMSGYTDARAAQFQKQLAAALEPQPGVQAVTFAMAVPGSWQNRQQEVLHTGSALLPKQQTVRVDSNAVGTGYFRAFGIQLLRGREFREADLAGHPVCIVNATMARRFWPDQPPLGQMVRVGGLNGVDHEVIGVARDTEYEKMGNDYAPFLYLPLDKADVFAALVRTSGRADAFAETVRRAVAAQDPDMPLLSTGPLADLLTGGGNGVELRLRVGIMGTLGAVAVVLSALGLYGVVAYLVSRRTREIGIRLALGASRTNVLAAVLRDGGKVVAFGMGIGVALSLVVSPLLANHVFGVTPNDPLVIASACAFLAAVAAVAMCVPARRACHVQATTALRYE